MIPPLMYPIPGIVMITEGINDILHLGVHIIDLPVQQFDLLDRLNDLDGQGMVTDADDFCARTLNAKAISFLQVTVGGRNKKVL